MTKDKAIIILTAVAEGQGDTYRRSLQIEAAKLGWQALDLLKRMSKTYLNPESLRLPAETLTD